MGNGLSRNSSRSRGTKERDTKCHPIPLFYKRRQLTDDIKLLLVLFVYDKKPSHTNLSVTQHNTPLDSFTRSQYNFHIYYNIRTGHDYGQQKRIYLGNLNCPSSDPSLPNDDSTLPLTSNICTRWLLLSETITLFVLLTAM